MADDCDRADELIQARIEEGLLLARLQPKKKRTVFESCYCGMADGIRFCSVACRNEHDEDRRIRERAGKLLD